MRSRIPRTSTSISAGRSRRSIPTLKDVEITHGWGGYVGITVPRKPFVREVMPNVISAGGYSGHGVMLSNFVGKLYAETVAGNRDRLKLFESLEYPCISRRPALAIAAALPGAQLVCAARSDLRRALFTETVRFAASWQTEARVSGFKLGEHGEGKCLPSAAASVEND